MVNVAGRFGFSFVFEFGGLVMDSDGGFTGMHSSNELNSMASRHTGQLLTSNFVFVSILAFGFCGGVCFAVPVEWAFVPLDLLLVLILPLPLTSLKVEEEDLFR